VGRFTIKIIIIGAGGHARAVYECLYHDKNFKVVAFIDNKIGEGTELIMGIPVYGPHSIVTEFMKKGVKGFIIAIGKNEIRTSYFKKFKDMGLEPINAIHSTASIGHNVKIGKGVVVGIGAIINTNAKIGDNSIVNTGAIIEHENIIQENIHICPGTSIAGRCVIKKNTFIGIGSVIKDYITIGENVIVGAGSVVLGNIPDNVVVIGSPAKIIKKNNNKL